MNEFSDDVGSGYYRSFDDIKNLKIRVRIRKKVPASISVSEPGRTIQSDSFELLQLQNVGKTCSADCTFSWQEKVSKEEENELRSSTAALHQIGNDDDGELCSVKIFSYVDSEVRSNSKFSSYFHGSSSDYAQTVRRRNVCSSSSNKTYQRPHICDVKDVVQIPSSKQRLHFIGQSMVIMANVKQDGSDSVELQLCLIHHDASGALIIVPDFSRSPYYIKTENYGTYEYVIENVSNSASVSDIQKEKSFQKQMAESHARALAAGVGSEFDAPSPKSVMVYLRGEIVHAKNFQAGSIFVRYTFQLPEGMTTENDQICTATTHSCKTKRIKGVSEAHFGHPFELSGEIELDKFASLDGQRPIIQMVIEVCSVDCWSICRNEGYGYCDIILQPGVYNHEIKTWKYLPQSLLGALKTFFIGGMPSFGDENYVRVPKDHKVKELNKYGTKTVTSGNISVNINTALQFGCEASSEDFVHQQKITSNH